MGCQSSTEQGPEFRGFTQKEQQIIQKIVDWYYPPVGWDRHTSSSPEMFKKHFASSKEIDDEILADYGPWIDKVAADELEHWKQTTDGRLAYMTLCD